jgi:hypothetical protein
MRQNHVALIEESEKLMMAQNYQPSKCAILVAVCGKAHHRRSSISDKCGKLDTQRRAVTSIVGRMKRRAFDEMCVRELCCAKRCISCRPIKNEARNCGR